MTRKMISRPKKPIDSNLEFDFLGNVAEQLFTIQDRAVRRERVREAIKQRMTHLFWQKLLSQSEVR